MNDCWGARTKRRYSIKIGLPSNRKIWRWRHLKGLGIARIGPCIWCHQWINELIAVGVSCGVVKKKLIVVTKQNWRIVREARATVDTCTRIWTWYLCNKGKAGVVWELQIGDVRPSTTALIRYGVAAWDGRKRQDYLINSALHTNTCRLCSARIIEVDR